MAAVGGAAPAAGAHSSTVRPAAAVAADWLARESPVEDSVAAEAAGAEMDYWMVRAHSRSSRGECGNALAGPIWATCSRAPLPE